MARVAYADESNPEAAPLAQRIRAERGGKVLNLYKMLLNSPPVAEGWLKLLTAIRQQCLLSGRMREMVILRIAVLNEAPYEFGQHVPFALKEGMSQEQIEALRQMDIGPLFNDVERAVVAYADSMTREIHVPDTVFDALRPHFSERELVELTATVASYNLVSRFLEALQIDHE